MFTSVHLLGGASPAGGHVGLDCRRAAVAAAGVLLSQFRILADPSIRTCATVFKCTQTPLISHRSDFLPAFDAAPTRASSKLQVAIGRAHEAAVLRAQCEAFVLVDILQIQPASTISRTPCYRMRKQRGRHIL